MPRRWIWRFIKQFYQGLLLGILLTLGLFAFWSILHANNQLEPTFTKSVYSSFPYNPQLDVIQKPQFSDVNDFLPYRNKQNGVSYAFCSCVTYAKALTGFSATVGPARNWPSNSEEPRIGGVVITSESKYGHVAVITEIHGGTLTLSEANYQPCKRTMGRRLPINSPLILGYWNP